VKAKYVYEFAEEKAYVGDQCPPRSVGEASPLLEVGLVNRPLPASCREGWTHLTSPTNT